ncbi:hypothetical protein J3A83DRAFT_1085987 [Scleroderma citrinum]
MVTSQLPEHVDLFLHIENSSLSSFYNNLVSIFRLFPWLNLLSGVNLIIDETSIRRIFPCHACIALIMISRGFNAVLILLFSAANGTPGEIIFCSGSKYSVIRAYSTHLISIMQGWPYYHSLRCVVLISCSHAY